MEDYWNVPRELIYRERENLNDFGVKDSHSLNGRLFQLLSEQFLSANGADTLLLQCFNNAYYLCTIILLEDLPHLKVDKYEENLLKMKVQWNRDALVLPRLLWRMRCCSCASLSIKKIVFYLKPSITDSVTMSGTE